MDNALTSAEKTKNRIITPETYQKNSYTVLIISNSCDMSPEINNGKLITTKKDKKIHDLGLKSVTKSVEKYDGDFDWQYDESKKEFIVTVMLFNKK